MTDLTERLLALRLSRRPVAIALAGMLAAPSLALAQGKKDDKDYSAELAKPTGLPEILLGKVDAPVSIYEYASMTCSHCAEFANKVLPQLKTKYIDTGKVKLFMREFPLDNLAAAASMLARCAGGEKTHEMIAGLFAHQDDWAFVQGNPQPALLKFSQQYGFDEKSFETCLTDQSVLDKITAERDFASKTLRVRATPTFFINGKRMEERSDRIESFDALLEPLLKG